MIAKIKCFIFGHFYKLHYWSNVPGGLKQINKCKNCGNLIIRLYKVRGTPLIATVLETLNKNQNDTISLR